MMNGNGRIGKSNSSPFNCMIKKFNLGFLFFVTTSIATLLFSASCTKEVPPSELKTISGTTMGTTFTVKIVDDKNITVNYDSLDLKIKNLLAEINKQMSTYIPESEISKFNNYDSTSWFSISYDFASLVQTSLNISKQTGGAFDITVGPLVNLWGFGPELKNTEIPGVKDLLNAKSKTGYHLIDVKIDTPSVRKSIADAYIDLSAIAKGFAVDKICEHLSSIEIKNYMVEIGGEVKTAGKNNKNESWKIGIETPDNQSTIQEIISISNYALATSGDYNNYFEENDVRYSHTIDPKTGMPVTHKLASVTVLHRSCTLADAYATAIDVMGPTAGYDFALKENLNILMIVRENASFKKITTSGFNKFIHSEN